jgi:drug/metabolite transporter (DMT)-like permease
VLERDVHRLHGGLTLTTVANVLVTMALGPLLTALFARIFIGHRHCARTWVAIVVAGVGIAWMYGSQVAGLPVLAGSLVACACRGGRGATGRWCSAASSPRPAVDLVPACWWGP